MLDQADGTLNMSFDRAVELGQDEFWSLEDHLSRIVWLAKNGWDDPIQIGLVGSRMQVQLSWPIWDGNHRVIAAWYRGDSYIRAELIGDLDLAEELFGPIESLEMELA